MMDRISDFRFLIPPTLLGVFVYLLGDMNLYKLVGNPIGNANISTIFGGGLILLSVGFSISSIGNALVKRYDLDLTPFDAEATKRIRNHFKNWPWDHKELQMESSANTIAEWTAISLRDKHMRSQVNKRWDMAMANLNCSIALLLVPYILIFYSCAHTGDHLILWGIWLFLEIIFLYLFSKSHKSVLEIINLLARELGEK